MLVLLMCAGLALSGCASRGGRTYTDGEVRTVKQIQSGTVIDVSEVMVEDDPSLLGPAIGGVVGGVVGSLFGSGAGRTLATVGGALVGAGAGALGESEFRKYKAIQITIELDNKQVVAVVQSPDDEFFVKGDRVLIIGTGEGRARVQHR